MDVVTLGQAKAQGDRRYAQLPTGMKLSDLPGQRKSTLCLTNPNNGTAVAARDVTERFLVRNPTSTTKWRVRIANRNRTTVMTTPVTITGLYVGSPAFEAANPYRWNGNFTAAPTQVWAGGSVPTDGTDLTSPWITSVNFAAGVDMLLSLGFTCPNSGSGVIVDQSIQSWMVTSSGSSQVGNQTLTGAAISVNPYLDIRIEFYTTDSAPIGLFLGDSITKGYGDGDVQAARQGCNVHEAWPGAAGLKGRFNFINSGYEGTKASDFVTFTDWTWQRIDFATTVPDFAVIAFGTNDASAGQSASTIIGNVITIMDKVASLGIKKIYLATITPRGFTTAGNLTAAANISDTTITSSVSFAATATIQINVGRSQEQKVVTSVSGTGPYTITVPALTKAHPGPTTFAPGAQVIGDKELTRQGYNESVRQLFHGAAGVIDFDAVLASAHGSTTPDVRLMSADLLHPMRAGYALMGAAAAALVA
jgi:lysophospholipase L1-like esterase